MHTKEMKAEAIRLRTEQRLSLREITQRIPVSKGTLSVWLRNLSLTHEEREAKRKPKRTAWRKPRGEQSPFHQVVANKPMSRQQKAKIAEAAVLFRLALHGFNVFGSVFDGDKADWVVQIPETGKICTLQVRWTKTGKHGLPSISLRCVEGHNQGTRFKEGDFDFIVGYDLYTDIAYVFSWADVSHLRSTVTITQDHAEAWYKLRE